MKATIAKSASAAPKHAKVTRQPARKQRTKAAIAALSPHVAPEKAASKGKASRAKKSHTGAAEAAGPREGSKNAQVIALLKREGGATLEEISTAMGWQPHTTRSLMSAGGSLAKKHGLPIISELVDGKRTYRFE